MGILALSADERVRDVRVSEDTLTVDLMDGRTISVPLVWYPRLLSGHVEATVELEGVRRWLRHSLARPRRRSRRGGFIAWCAGTGRFCTSPNKPLQATAKSASSSPANQVLQRTAAVQFGFPQYPVAAAELTCSLTKPRRIP